jgi:hypothetical protein
MSKIVWNLHLSGDSSSVSIVTRLRAGKLRTQEILFLTGARDFSLLHSIQITSMTHPEYYLIGIVGFFSWSKVSKA